MGLAPHVRFGRWAVCLPTMSDQDAINLRQSVEEAIGLFRGNSAPMRAALSPVVDSLESLCASLQRSVAHAHADDTRAAILVITRDLTANALREMAQTDVDGRTVMLALATLHNRIVAALESCTEPAGR